MGYTKLFSEIVASSIWEEDDKTRLVWITMLALKDRSHHVRGTPSYLARVARVTDDECQVALAKLSGPDPHSRSTEHEGRRISDVPGGWVVLNGDRYQKMLSYEERREYNRQKQAEYRRRKKVIIRDGACAGAQQAIKDGFAEAHGEDPQ
jgi:hypothetical protein